MMFSLGSVTVLVEQSACPDDGITAFLDFPRSSAKGNR